jgi:hypothetical protein
MTNVEKEREALRTAIYHEKSCLSILLLKTTNRLMVSHNANMYTHGGIFFRIYCTFWVFIDWKLSMSLIFPNQGRNFVDFNQSNFLEFFTSNNIPYYMDSEWIRTKQNETF